MLIDAMGKACPLPVLLAKKELDAGVSPVTIHVDNDIAVSNLQRLGTASGCAVSMENIEGGFAVTFTREGDAPVAAPVSVVEIQNCGGRPVFFIGKDHIGEGSDELGANLLDMALFTLSKQEEPLPEAIIFMNGGVKVACKEGQTAEALQTLIERGVAVLVCGTCLNYFGIADDLKAGTVSNMYEILTRMQQAGSVISL